MEKFFFWFLDYLRQAVVATAIQLFVLLGPLVILAILMSLISAQIRNLAPKVFGYKTWVYGFKWLGTPIHELGHALFAIIFGHRITRMKLFDPNASDGSYGYVEHSHARGNIYQETGQFFIGIGPVLLGSMMLYLITYLLFSFSIHDLNQVAISSSSLTSLSSLKAVGLGIASGLKNFLTLVFHGSQSTWWKILLFIYLLFSIGSSITLSLPDIRGALYGFFYFIAIVFIFNLLTIWIGNFAVGALAKTGAFFSGFYFLMILSIIINGLFALMLALLVPVINLIFSRS